MAQSDRPLRVLIATDTYPPDVNGAGYFTHRLAEGLARRGHRVHVACPSERGEPYVTVNGAVTEHRMRSAPIPFQPSMRAAVPLGLGGHIARIVQRMDPDVVHAQSHFPLSRSALRKGRAAGIPVVLTNHFMPDNLYAHARVPAPMRELAGTLAWKDMVRVASEADYVTTPTPRAARLLREQGFARTVEDISCGIDLERFHPRGGDRAAARRRFGLPDRDTIVFVGRLDEEKRIGDTIRALAGIVPERDAQLALAGVGQREKELRALAVELGVADRVFFLGFVPDEDLPLVYAAGDAFAIAGVAELQSIATLEAMSTGLPVVAADAMALPHLLEEGRNGFLFPPGDVERLADRLLTVLGPEKDRRAMGEASREIALRHDHHRSLERFEETYKRLRGAPPVPLWVERAVAARPVAV
ncbi:glycosyltransferase [Nocardiopsis quinghaiensis]|uniref:glycosyltransferase n=1 Tax=Nocardiopsis quinghaiensis TaxID=464995 RepID=UPI0012398E5A|nr:glycosyltransferase [Nocardiopsis quinghaiensis]